MNDDIRIAAVHDTAEISQCEAVQRQVWSMGDGEIVPTHMLVAAVHKGGLLLGAWRGQEMIGFVFGFLGRDHAGHLLHHSHMAAVLPAYQGAGVGLALKIAQARHVAGQGLDLITWTYDPLEARNAHFNLNRLGAIARTYLVNHYGAMTDDLNRGLESDRLEAELWIRSEHVQARMEQTTPQADPFASVPTLAATWRDDLPRPPDVALPDSPAPMLVEIPPQFQRVKQRDLGLARAWRRYFRHICQAAFAAELTITALQRLAGQPDESPHMRVFYLFETVPPGITGISPDTR